MTLPQNLLSTTQEHLEELIAQNVQEGPHLDFKRDFPTNWNNETKHELLADVSAFANSGGGDLIFGMNEDGKAHASALVPIKDINPDQEIRRLQDFFLNQVEPRLPNVQVFAVAVEEKNVTGYVLIVRIAQSWVGPHRVKTNQHFYVRDGLRKRQLDVPEIRSLFLRSDSQSQKLRDFRTERLGKVLSGETPHRLVNGPVLVVHIIPTQSALGLVQIDPIPYVNGQVLPLIASPSGSTRLNIDGALVVRNENSNRETHGYSQFFRNGFFESTKVISLSQETQCFTLPSVKYEKELLTLFGKFREELVRLNLSTECAVMLSLTRANEVTFGASDENSLNYSNKRLFDRHTLTLPDVLAIEDLCPELALKPAFDLMCQAAGLERSTNYDTEGNYIK